MKLNLLLIKEKNNYFSNKLLKKCIWESKFISRRTNQFIGIWYGSSDKTVRIKQVQLSQPSYNICSVMTDEIFHKMNELAHVNNATLYRTD